MVAPDGLGQRLLVDQVARTMEEVGQDAVFLASETELAVGDENLERLRQQSDVAQPDIHLAGLSAAADDTADARMQFG